jgi:hypothetical protein
MEETVIEKTSEAIKRIMEDGIATSNIDNLYKLSKIKHLAKEDKEMYGEYGNYGGRRPGYDSYGNYGNYGEYGRGNYGRRGRDMKYRGDDELDRITGEYGRYQESRSRYGAGEESNRSFHYMVKSLEDFIRVLYEEADTEQQKQQLRETLQRSMM